MRVVGTLLVWTAKILGILVGMNLGWLLKQYMVVRRGWDMAFFAILLHAFVLLPVWGLYRAGTWCKAPAKRTIGDHGVSGA